MTPTSAPLAEHHVELTALLVRGLVTLEPDDFPPANMTLELGLTLWMTRARSDLPAVRRSLFELRQALLEASVLEEKSEPIPLMAGDERKAVLSLAVYVWGLLQRAARSVESPAVALAEEVLAQLR
jgi:hypothetical protein